MSKLISAARSRTESKRTDIQSSSQTTNGQPCDNVVQSRKRAEMVMIKERTARVLREGARTDKERDEAVKR